MTIVQTSDTTFELQSDNGCTAYAGWSSETMGSDGVYFIRADFPMRKDQVLDLFRRDPRVQASIQSRRERTRQMMRERERNVAAVVSLVCAVAMAVVSLGSLIYAVSAGFKSAPIAPYSLCESCGELIQSNNHGCCAAGQIANKEIK